MKGGGEKDIRGTGRVGFARGTHAIKKRARKIRGEAEGK